MDDEIATMLDQLAEYEAQRDGLDIARVEQAKSVIPPEVSARIADLQRQLDEAMPPEIRQKLDDMQAEFWGKAEAVDKNIADLKAKIQEEVLKRGATVKGTYIMAVYTKPRAKWDTAMLDGMIALVPQIEKAKTVGEPTVSIRHNKA